MKERGMQLPSDPWVQTFASHCTVGSTSRGFRAIYQLAMVTGCLLLCETMPIRYREVLEYMHGYLAAYPLGFEADDTGHQYIAADRNGYRLGESSDLAIIEEMVKGENEVFSKAMQRKTFGQLIAMFASLPSSGEEGEQRAIV